MPTYTTNYQLHQWEASDDFLRTDFNTDFQKLDAAIKGVETAANTALAGKAGTAALEAVQTLAEGKCAVLSGTYTGGGSSPRSISLGLYPKAVFVYGGNSSTYVGIRESPDSGFVHLHADGFHVRHNNDVFSTNKAYETYYYLAVV